MSEEWEEVIITVDSGAVDTVAPPNVSTDLPIVPTEASISGPYYKAANDTNISIHGKKRLKGVTAGGTPIAIDTKVVDVKKMLGSVRQMCGSGNRVVFDEEGRFMENKRTGKITAIKQEGGAYIMRMWMPRKEERQGDFQRLARN